VRTHTVIPARRNTLAVVFGILAIATLIATIIGWFRSIDVRGWWPVGILIHLLVDFVYAFAFVALTRSARPISLLFVAGYNAALGFLVVVHSVLFYSTKPGDGGWQKLIHSDSTLIGAYGVFLLGAAVLALSWRNRNRNG
jgi:hypothetical protein